MDLNELKTHVGEWLKGGPEGDVVVSSRVRLARNIAGYPFVPRASEQEIERIEELLSRKVQGCDLAPDVTYYRLDQMDHLKVEFLMERHLISRDHADADWVRGVAFGDGERVSVMINEEDHLRLQVMRGGLRLEELWEQMNELDDKLEAEIPFACSPKYGYLTACPTNAGTGMRASAMLHLPAIVLSQEMDSVIREVRDERLTLRGLFGEGTQGTGDLYQLSNQVTLGVEEEEIVEQVGEAASHVAGLERAARQRLHDKHKNEIHNRLSRARDLLLSAKMISSEEALHFLSQVRLAVEMNLMTGIPLEALNELFLLTLPAHLQTIEDRVMGSTERNKVRAKHIRQRLSTG